MASVDVFSCFPNLSPHARAKVGEQEENVESRRKRREVKVWHQSICSPALLMFFPMQEKK